MNIATNSKLQVSIVVGIVAMLMLIPAIDLDARERGERQHSPDRGNGVHAPAPPPVPVPVVIPKEILEEWKDDLEEGNIDKVVEEFEDIVENGLPEVGGDETGEAEESSDRRNRTRNITRDRGGEPAPEETTPEEDPTPEEPPVSDDVEELTYEGEVALEILRLTNVERENLGLPPLEYDTRLSDIAQVHSAYMAETGYFSHSTAEGCDLKCRLDGEGHVTSMWGENIAWSRPAELPSAEELALMFVRSLVNSSGHRDNMLSVDFTHTGVGVAEGDGVLFATVDFAKL